MSITCKPEKKHNTYTSFYIYLFSDKKFLSNKSKARVDFVDDTKNSAESVPIRALLDIHPSFIKKILAYKSTEVNISVNELGRCDQNNIAREHEKYVKRWFDYGQVYKSDPGSTTLFNYSSLTNIIAIKEILCHIKIFDKKMIISSPLHHVEWSYNTKRNIYTLRKCVTIDRYEDMESNDYIYFDLSPRTATSIHLHLNDGNVLYHDVRRNKIYSNTKEILRTHPKYNKYVRSLSRYINETNKFILNLFPEAYNIL
jgi:hypothetical protein